MYGGRDCEGSGVSVVLCNMYMSYIYRPMYGGLDCEGSCVSVVLCNMYMSYIYRPMYGGRDCEGSEVTGVLCNTQPCDTSMLDIPNHGTTGELLITDHSTGNMSMNYS